jgi:hypothetical protein
VRWQCPLTPDAACLEIAPRARGELAGLSVPPGLGAHSRGLEHAARGGGLELQAGETQEAGVLSSSPGVGLTVADAPEGATGGLTPELNAPSCQATMTAMPPTTTSVVPTPRATLAATDHPALALTWPAPEAWSTSKACTPLPLSMLTSCQPGPGGFSTTGVPRTGLGAPMMNPSSLGAPTLERGW